MSLLRQGIKALMMSVLPRNRILGRGPLSSNAIALTFDDGPHPDYTPCVLDELERLKIHATFFVVGQAAERHPEIMKRMVAEGHTIGCHTYSHSEPSATSAAKLQDEVRRSLALIEDVTCQRPTLFRPPKGKLTLEKTIKLWGMHQTIVLWNRDPRDYQAACPEGILPWVNQYQPQSGDIVLMHDTHPHCIHAIEPLARIAALSQIGFCTVDEWLSSRSRLGRPMKEELILQTTAAGRVHIPKGRRPE